MIIDLSAEAREYGQLAKRALEAAGGHQLTETAEAEPDKRGLVVTAVFDELGAWDLNPRDDAGELEAAAAICRSAGYWGLAYPVAERLAKPRDLAADGLIVVADRLPAAPGLGLDLEWVAVTVDGVRSRARGGEPVTSPRASAFVTPLTLEHLDDNGLGDVALGLLLPCWTVLGMLDRAIDLARTHVQDRVQFGQPLAKFQNVQFMLADAEVERTGLDVLAKYTLWSVQVDREEALDDAIALRLAAIEAADVVFRTAHQLHGAIGFCDESNLSWLSRYSGPLRQLPFGLSTTREMLATRISDRGLHGLFTPAGLSA